MMFSAGPTVIVDGEAKPVDACAVSPPGARFPARKDAMALGLLRVGDAAYRWLGSTAIAHPGSSDRSAELPEEHTTPTTVVSVPVQGVDSSESVAGGPP